MQKSVILCGAAAVLAGCGQSADSGSANNAAANSAAAEAPKPAYCFFKDSETKDWKAKRDKKGNVVLTGKAYRQDSRYKAVLSPATVSGTSAVVAPTIIQNEGPYGAPDDWWDVSQTIPDSQQVTTVTVKCGDGTVASLTVPRKK